MLVSGWSAGWSPFAHFFSVVQGGGGLKIAHAESTERKKCQRRKWEETKQSSPGVNEPSRCVLQRGLQCGLHLEKKAPAQ